MTTTLFDIQNMACSYDNGNTVILSVSDLKIERGKFYFIIGKSGIGKSTLLESIGMMSDTISPESKVMYCGQHQLKQLWQSDFAPEFRARNYSFIFQENNLLENFTAGENMSFGLLLAGQNISDARDKILPLMTAIDLPHELYDKKIQNLSGGQRQRVAFVRALTAPFEVMFCDEPTGNLDPVVANKLMTVLRDQVIDQNKTAIIVSHSIELADEYADHVVVIKSGKDSIGKINLSQLYHKRDKVWYGNEGNRMSEFYDFLRQQIS